MALIRQAQCGDLVKNAIVLDLGDLKRQAEVIKAAARAEADAIVAAARAEHAALVRGAAEEGRREGYARGLAEGREQGAAEGREASIADLRPRFEALEKSWTAALEEFAARRDKLMAGARADVLRFAARVAEMVTRRTVELDRGAAEAQLTAAFQLLARSSKAVIRVHPSDRKAFATALPRVAQRLESAAEAELAADESLAPGSCVIATPSGGEIDASIDTQIERITAAVAPRPPKKGRGK